MQNLTTELAVAIRSGSTFSIARVFDFLELTASNVSLQKQLVARGEFVLKAGLYGNSGRPITELVHDLAPAVGDMQLYLPRKLKVRASIAHDVVGLDLDNTRVIATFFTPPAPGIGNRYLLRRLELDSAKTTYFFDSEDASAQNIELRADYYLDPSALFRGRAAAGFASPHLQLMAAEMFAELNCCGGFKAKECFDVPGPKRIRVHAFVLFAPAVSVEQQIANMNVIYANADITVQLVDIQVLNLPALLDLDVGSCVLGQTTADQRELFSHRGTSSPGDICAYWVRSLIPGGFVGCAAHPENLPSAVCAPGGTQFLLSHEIGHVLGLFHVNDARRIMNPVDAFQDPPPDLVPEEAAAIRCSPWTGPL